MVDVGQRGPTRCLMSSPLSIRELMPSVARHPDGERPIGALAELSIDPPVGLQGHKALRRVETTRRADGRHEVRVAGHEDDRVAQVSADDFEQPRPDGHVRLLLLPTDACAAAQWARLALGFEVAELELNAGGLEGREVRHLTRDRARMARGKKKEAPPVRGDPNGGEDYLECTSPARGSKCIWNSCATARAPATWAPRAPARGFSTCSPTSARSRA